MRLYKACVHIHIYIGIAAERTRTNAIIITARCNLQQHSRSLEQVNKGVIRGHLPLTLYMQSVCSLLGAGPRQVTASRNKVATALGEESVWRCLVIIIACPCRFVRVLCFPKHFALYRNELCRLTLPAQNTTRTNPPRMYR